MHGGWNGAATRRGAAEYMGEPRARASAPPSTERLFPQLHPRPDKAARKMKRSRQRSSPNQGAFAPAKGQFHVRSSNREVMSVKIEDLYSGRLPCARDAMERKEQSLSPHTELRASINSRTVLHPFTFDKCRSLQSRTSALVLDRLFHT